jgi:hypothetical protein
MGSGQLALRLATLILIIGAVGLPINAIATYGLVLAATVAVFTGTIATRWRRWAAAAIVTIVVVAAHMIWPLPRIQEGHNVFLPSARVAETSGLPRDVLDLMIRQFDAEYPPERRCDNPALGCWRPDRTTQADGFAFSADAIFDRSAVSRNVPGIGFSDPAYLRLGFINDYIYGWPDNETGFRPPLPAAACAGPARWRGRAATSSSKRWCTRSGNAGRLPRGTSAGAFSAYRFGMILGSPWRWNPTHWCRSTAPQVHS